MKYIKIVIFLVCLGAVATLSVNAISIRSLLGLDDEESETQAASPDKEASESVKPSAKTTGTNWAKSNESEAAAEIDLALVKRLLANLDAATMPLVN